MQTLIDQYIDSYMTSRLARAKAAYTEVETKLQGDYTSQVMARTALMEQAKAARAERVIIDEAMIKWRELKAESPNKYSAESSKAKEINTLWATLRSTAVVDAQSGSADATRRVEVEIAQVEKLFDIPEGIAPAINEGTQAALTAFTNILAQTNTTDPTASNKIGAATNTYVTTMETITSGLNEEARLAAAARVTESLIAAYEKSGIQTSENFDVKELVATKFGLADPEMATTEYVETAKRQEKDAAQKKTYGARQLNTTTWQLARSRLDELLGVDESAKLEARARIAAQFTPETWRAVKEDLLDNGRIDTVDEASKALYEQAKAAGGLVPGEDEIFFDDLFIEQLRRRGRLTEEESLLIDQASKITPVAPTPDDIRKGAAKIPYAPKSPTLRRASLKDKDAVMSEAYDRNKARIVHEKVHPQAKSIHNQISQGTMQRDQLFTVAREITHTSDETQQLIADVMYLDAE